MKKIALGLLLAGCLHTHKASPVCSNNQSGCQHTKKYGAGRAYSCKCKTKGFYGDDANRYYEGNSCATCGCESEEHTDE